MSGADVESFDVVRKFCAAVATFADEARDALATYDIELRRTLDWLLDLQPEAWKLEIRRSEDAIQEAKIALTRCKMQKLPGGGEPACMEEKKALARAKYRLEFSQDKLVATKKWGHAFSREATQYTSQATQLGDLFDADLPRALAMLDRAILALQAYADLTSGHEPVGLAPVSRPLDASAAAGQQPPSETPPAGQAEAGPTADSGAAPPASPAQVAPAPEPKVES